VATVNSGFKLSILITNNMVDSQTSEVKAIVAPLNPSPEIEYAKSCEEPIICTLFCEMQENPPKIVA
jgi:hypothetical protein